MRLNNFGRVLEHRCEVCDQQIFTRCDKDSKSSYEKMLTGRAKDPSSKHWFFQTALTPEKLCFNCRNQKELEIGKFDGIEIKTPIGNNFGIRKTIPHRPKTETLKDRTDTELEKWEGKHKRENAIHRAKLEYKLQH